MIGIGASTFYYRPKVSREERERQDADLRSRIEQVRVEQPNTGEKAEVQRKAQEVKEQVALETALQEGKLPQVSAFFA